MNGMHRPIRIACANVISRLDDIEYNMRVMKQAMREAVNNEADLILFGEAFLQGFEAMRFVYKEDVQKALFQTGVEITKVRQWAKESNLAVGFGYYENKAGGLYSSYMFIDEKGAILNNYRRVSRGWKKSHTNPDYREGRTFQNFTWRNLRMTPLVCGDFWEDELITTIAACDPVTDLFLWPVHCDYPEDKWDNEERKAYRERSQILEKPILFYNNYIDEKNRAQGGTYLWRQGKELFSQAYGVSKIAYLTFTPKP